MATASPAAPAARAARAALALAAGASVALSVPPWGWWPLAFAGLAALCRLLRAPRAGTRALAGALFGLGMFTPGLWWMGEFNVVGAALVVLLETSFVTLAALVTPPGRWASLALPATLVLAEAARGAVPFGGLPMAGVALGQVGGPLAPAARLGGALLVLAVAVAAGVALAEAAERRWVATAVALAVAVAPAALGAVAPDGGAGPTLRAAVVQGGGPVGFRAVETDEGEVFAAHLDASGRLRPPLDLVLWPEDVVDVDGPVLATPAAGALAALARRAGAVLVAGVVEGAGPDHFRNAAVAWGPTGQVVDRYDKVHRVPFGEYVPGRALVDRVADLSAIPRDALPGTGPGVLRTPAGRLGVLVSFEVFFAERARAAVRAGGHVLLVPTNAASFSTTQVPTQEVAAARLRAIETGRDVVQAAPTGYSAYVDNHGRVLARSTLGRRQVIHRQVTLRAGRTPYARWGDAPVLALALVTAAASWAGRGRRPRAAPQPG